MEPSEMNRKCPFCAEIVKSEALTCRYCQKEISTRVRFRCENANPKETYQAINKLLTHPKNLFTFGQLKKILSKKNGVLKDRISLFDAQGLLQIAEQTVLELDLDESPPPNQTPKTPIGFVEPPPRNPSSNPFVSKINGWWISLIFVVVIAALGGFLLHRTSNNKIKQSITASALPKTTLADEQKKFVKRMAQRTGMSSAQETLIKATATITDRNTLGSGFFIDSNGYLVTNVHVIEYMRHPTVLLEGGEKYAAEVIRKDPRLDIAILKVNGSDFSFLPLGDATAMHRGDTVWTIGAPHGFHFTLTKGIISFVGRNMKGIAYLQSDAAINRGNSGGPLINEKGEVIGINTFIIRGSEGLGFSLPTNYLYMGDGTILTGILETQQPNTKMKEWYAMAQGISNPGVASEIPSPKNEKKRFNYINDLIKRSNRLDEGYQNVAKRITRDIDRLKREKSHLSQIYHSQNASITISQETQIGRELKRTSLRLIDREIDLLIRSKRYYLAKKKNLNKIINRADKHPARNQFIQAYNQASSLFEKSINDLENKKAERRALQTEQF